MTKNLFDNFPLLTLLKLSPMSKHSSKPVCQYLSGKLQITSPPEQIAHPFIQMPLRHVPTPLLMLSLLLIQSPQRGNLQALVSCLALSPKQLVGEGEKLQSQEGFVPAEQPDQQLHQLITF